MRKHICRIFIITGIFLGILGIFSVYAAFSDSVTVRNRIVTGDVNISLKEYQKKNGKEILYRNPIEILPGDFISKIPRITNDGMPCWLRAKISFGNEGKKQEGFKEEHIQGIPKEWKKIGEYYYYTKILHTGKSAELFTGLSVPSNWTEEHALQKLQIKIQADAIQAANFNPDFREMSPWGNKVIEACIHETNGKTDCKLENVELSVKFHGDAQKLLAVPDHFFKNFGKIMPGDVQKDAVRISNTDKETAEIFFHTGIENQTEEQLALLKKLSLTISMNGSTLYKGDLRAASLGKQVSLGKFRPQTEGTLDFTISAPTDLKNAYALRDAAVNWTFTVNKKSFSATGSPEPQKNPDDLSKGAGTSPVKTGDDAPVLQMLILLALSAALSTAYLKLKKGDTEV